MKKVLILFFSVLAAAALTVGCAKKDAAQETAAEAAGTVEQTAAKGAETETEKVKETRAQKYDVELDEDYSNAMGDSDEFLIDSFGEAISQKEDKNGYIIAEYSNDDHEATFFIAVYSEKEEEEPEDLGEIPQGVEGGIRDIESEDDTADEELYEASEVFYAKTTAGDLFNMKTDTMAIDELLKIFNAEEVNKSADGKTLTFMSDGYYFKVSLSDPDNISKDDDAIIVTEEHSGDII